MINNGLEDAKGEMSPQMEQKEQGNVHKEAKAGGAGIRTPDLLYAKQTFCP